MGRKGVSKQKSKQPAAKPQSKSAEMPLVKSSAPGKSDHANDRKPNAKKG